MVCPGDLLCAGTPSQGFLGRRLARLARPYGRVGSFASAKLLRRKPLAGLLRAIAAIGRKPRDGGCTTSPQRLLGHVVGCILAVLTCITPLGTALAATTDIAAGDLTIRVNDTGRIVALTDSDGNDHLAPGYSPPLLKLIVAENTVDPPLKAWELLPNGFEPFPSNPRQHVLTFDGAEVRLEVEERDDYVTLKLRHLTSEFLDVRAAMWGPYELSIGQQVADVAGIAYSRDFAIGIQALNQKTFAGTPWEFADPSFATNVLGNVAAAKSLFSVDKPPTLLYAVYDRAQYSVTLTYDEALDTAARPAGDAFVVRFGSDRNRVLNVGILGDTVTLRLTFGRGASQDVSVSYSPPTGGSAIRDASNNEAAALDGVQVRNHIVRPTGVITTTGTHPTNHPFDVTITFSEEVTAFAADDVTVTNGTGSRFSGAGTTYTLTVTPDGDYAGDVTVTVLSRAARGSDSGNLNTEFDATFAVDTRGLLGLVFGIGGCPGYLQHQPQLRRHAHPDADLRREAGRWQCAGERGVSCLGRSGRGDAGAAETGGKPGRGFGVGPGPGVDFGAYGDIEAAGRGAGGARGTCELYAAERLEAAGWSGQNGAGAERHSSDERDLLAADQPHHLW